MKAYSINNKQIKSFKFWENLHLLFYMVVMLFLVLIMFMPFFISSDIRWNPEYETLAKLTMLSLLIGVLTVLFLLIRQLIRFNAFLDKIIKTFSNILVEVNEKEIIISTGKSNSKFALDEVELHNYIVNTGAKNCFFGQGYLSIITPNKQSILIPSLIFNPQTGAYKIRDLFKHRNNYSQFKMKMKDFNNVYH